MSLFGRNDQAISANSTTTRATTTGAPLGTSALVNRGGGPNSHFGNTSPGSRAAVEVSMFGNTTASAFVTGATIGVFGVDTAEIAVNRRIPHAGWNLRTEGTGGRAGRVQYECLVAMGSLGAQTAAFGTPATVADAADDAILPDA